MSEFLDGLQPRGGMPMQWQISHSRMTLLVAAQRDTRPVDHCLVVVWGCRAGGVGSRQILEIPWQWFCGCHTHRHCRQCSLSGSSDHVLAQTVSAILIRKKLCFINQLNHEAVYTTHLELSQLGENQGETAI